MKKFTALVLSFVCVLGLAACGREAASIGIIGGADGPTAIFVTSNMDWLKVLGWISVIIAAILVGLVIHRSRNKK